VLLQDLGDIAPLVEQLLIRLFVSVPAPFHQTLIKQEFDSPVEQAHSPFLVPGPLHNSMLAMVSLCGIYISEYQLPK
jgi:hypothetical protein